VIATLTGTLAVRGANRIVVETVGVGYEVLIPLSTYYRLPPTGERVVLEIRQVVRADALTLYGFSTGTEKRAFDLLMSVQHVGPKLALAILSVLAPEELVAAIAKGDVERIDAVPGVGPKVDAKYLQHLCLFSYGRSSRDTAGSNPPRSANQSTIFAFSAEKSKILDTRNLPSY
jgi:Holliday junction DNA helicase RuvA